MSSIFHITSRAEADAASSAGCYVPTDFESDGFIHCSYAHQIPRVANFRYRGRNDLVLLEIDRSAFDDVRDENLEGGSELFPHIYSELPMAAVIAVHEFPCRDDGRFEVPSSIRV